jgi:putative ABC transport system permease protein
LKIVGTLGDRAPDGVILFRRDYLEEILGRPGKVNAFFVKLDRSESAPDAIADIDRTFANSSSETSTGTEADAIRERVGTLALLMNGAKFFAAVVILTIGLVAANTAAMAVRERRHEIGVMRAIGFTRGNVLTGIIIEGLVIGVTAGILGCALARLGFLILPYAGGALGPLAMRLKLSPRIIANSFAVATGIGAMSSFIPAMFATRGDISTKLRAI